MARVRVIHFSAPEQRPCVLAFTTFERPRALSNWVRARFNVRIRRRPFAVRRKMFFPTSAAHKSRASRLFDNCSPAAHERKLFRRSPRAAENCYYCRARFRAVPVRRIRKLIEKRNKSRPKNNCCCLP